MNQMNGSADALASAELSVKLFVEDPAAVDLEELIPVFHRWIREDRLEGELPIDVAGYAHVPKGPGVVLICDHSHYYFDERDGRPGMRYRGRRVPRGSGEEGITKAFRCALRAAALRFTAETIGLAACAAVAPSSATSAAARREVARRTIDIVCSGA